jgi:hypothetical protein
VPIDADIGCLALAATLHGLCNPLPFRLEGRATVPLGAQDFSPCRSRRFTPPASSACATEAGR